MIRVKRLSHVAILALWCCLSFAAPPSAPVRAEIDALLSKLEGSGCQFNRNGTWYSASEAKDHLLRKLEYLEGRTTIQSTEQFIELAGSTSSTSGEAYQVKCGDGSPVESRQWLIGQLASIRGSVGKVKP